ncbi:MAG: hypothetical protein [Circular genetic element sp.]|nr:MAG: hypothetical protein [Circular genetic element sp.]
MNGGHYVRQRPRYDSYSKCRNFYSRSVTSCCCRMCRCVRNSDHTITASGSSRSIFQNCRNRYWYRYHRYCRWRTGIWRIALFSANKRSMPGVPRCVQVHGRCHGTPGHQHER